MGKGLEASSELALTSILFQVLAILQIFDTWALYNQLDLYKASHIHHRFIVRLIIKALLVSTQFSNSYAVNKSY
jgi:hypothetical protein